MVVEVGSAVDWPAVFAERTARMQPSQIRGFLKLLGDPEIISFAGGIPDPALFPVEPITDAANTILADPSLRNHALQYGPSEGYGPLREWIVGHMARRGVPCATGNVVITTGSQQALDLIARVLIDAGDLVLTTAPSYLGAIQALTIYGPRWGTLDLDRPDAKATWRRATAAYLVPEFSNPDGTTLSLTDRHRLLDLATQGVTVVIEDAAYEALRFEGNHLPALQGLDIARCGSIEDSRVLYAGTFSKTIAPGLRVGWIVAPGAVVEKIVLALQAAELHSSMLDQMIVHQVVAAGFDAQVARLLPVYRQRRDAMLAALDTHMPAGVTWERPAGGMFVWLTLPEGMDSLALLADSLANDKVIFVPGTSFFPDGSGHRYLRLNYTRSDEATIEEGIARLGRAIERMMEVQE
jgi:DNA-binding transcriptional MocR family regulator